MDPEQLQYLKRQLAMLAGDLRPLAEPAIFFFVQLHDPELGWRDLALAVHPTQEEAEEDRLRAANFPWVQRQTAEPLRIVKRTVTVSEEVVS